MFGEEVLVIELASVLAGPSVGMFFAEQGATVIKVENPQGGDVTRGWRLPVEPATEDRTAYFCAVNWGKKSICLNLKDADGRAKLHLLLQQADVLISSFRPGQAETLDLDPADLLQKYPQLILGEISGYGPEDRRPAFDAIIQAETGFTHLNGTAGTGKEKMPVALMDVLAAHQLKEGILLAWIKRLQTGKGSRVTVDLCRSGIASLVNQATNYLNTGQVPQPLGSAHPNIAPYGVAYPTQDGAIILAVGNDGQFARLAQVLGWQPADHFRTNAQRVQARTSLDLILEEKIARWETAPLLLALDQAGVPCGPIHTMPQVFQLPEAQDLLLSGGGRRGVRSYVGNVGTSDREISPPPHLGQHQQFVAKTYWNSLQD